MSALLSADEQLFLWINGIAGKVPILDKIMCAVVDDYFIITVMALIMLALWFIAGSNAQRERNQRAIMWAGLGLGLACTFVYIINMHYFRPHPIPAHLLTYPRSDSSFPSEPAAVTFALATGICFVHRKAGAVMLLLATIFSFSRIYCGVHYPLDIVAGAIIGASSSFIAFMLFTTIFRFVPTLVLKLLRWLYLA